MRFSIIIPAHNSELYITKALESIKKQTFKDYELIVVCDMCTDNTQAVAQMYGAKTCSVEFANDGLSRSKGLDLATGEYILFMDDDDWWLHEFVLEQLDKKLKEIGAVDVLCFSFIFRGVCYASPLGNLGEHWVSVWNKCWKREVVGDTRFPRVHSCSDKYFHEAMMKKHPTMYEWDMPIYYYNFLRKGSITQKDGLVSAEVLRKCLNT